MKHATKPRKPSLWFSWLLGIVAAFMFYCAVAAMTFGHTSEATKGGLACGLLGCALIFWIGLRIERRNNS